MDICYILSYHVCRDVGWYATMVYATLRYHHNSVLQWLRIHTYTLYVPMDIPNILVYAHGRHVGWYATMVYHMLTVYTACMLTPMLRAITCYHRMVYPLCTAMCTIA